MNTSLSPRAQAILARFEAELSESSPHTIQSRVPYARMWLVFAGDNFSEWNKVLVNKFLAKLREDGYSPGTIRQIYSVVKRVFDAAKAVYEMEKASLISVIDPNDPAAVAQVIKAMALPGPTWDLGKRAAPKVEREQTITPRLTLQQVEALIKTDLKPADTAYLALSSIYGLRCGELCAVKREHIDFQNKTIYVMTEKDGERRNQLLCDEVIPYLQNYDFPRPLSLSGMTKLYHRICSRAGIEYEYGSGWHSMRRFLDDELIRLFGDFKTHVFFRWKQSSMPAHYFGAMLEVDQEILAGHPVVKIWQER